MMNFHRVCLVLCCGLLPALCFSGCAKKDDALARVHAAGALRVGVDPSWPPFEFVQSDGQIAGLDVDLARALGQKLGVEVQFVVSGWEGLYGALATGQFDAIISALPYDPWRTQEVAYSSAYFNAGPVIVAHAGQTGLRHVKDLNGYTVHVEFGAESDVQARRLRKKYPQMVIAPHDTAQAALEALCKEPTQAAIVDAVSARLYIRAHRRLEIVGEPLYDESYVIAVPAAARSLQTAIDEALIEMRENGELDAILERWL